MFERFSDKSRRVLALAQEEAGLLAHNFLGTEHILLGLLRESEGTAAKALASLGVSLEAVREKVATTIGPVSGPVGGAPPFTPRSKKVLELALREALQLGHNEIGTEHLLLGLIREGEGVAVQVLIQLGADRSRVREEVMRRLPLIPPERSGPGRPRRPPRRGALVGPGPGVTAGPVRIDPTALVTWDDVEEVLRGVAGLDQATVVGWDVQGVAHRSCEYVPRTLPTLTVSVVGADVESEAFERLMTERSGEPVDGVGDAAVYDGSSSTLTVRKGSVVFSITASGVPDPVAAATALAHKAAARIENAS